jgi:hypothetical protein
MCSAWISEQTATIFLHNINVTGFDNGDKSVYCAIRTASIKTMYTDVSSAMAHAVVVGLLPQRPGFDPRSVYKRFVVAEVAPGHVFLTVDLLRFYPVCIINTLLLPDQRERPGNLPVQNALA